MAGEQGRVPVLAVGTGRGFVVGEVFDDSRGTPLEGAVITLLAEGGGKPLEQVTTPSGQDGSFVLSSVAGDSLLRVSRPGFSSVDRRVQVLANEAVVALDARLTPTDAPSEQRIP